jgi:serine/threonine protein kinase
MTRPGQVDDLLAKWELSHAAGSPASLADLCRDSPELMGPLEEAIRDRVKLTGGTGSRNPLTTFTFPHDVSSIRSESVHLPELPGYELLERVGQGGMGVVYKARQTALDRFVAIKTILPHGALRDEQRRRFDREAKVMASLQHPNVVQIHEIGEGDDFPYLVMEYLQGGRLSDRIEGRPMETHEASELIAVLARCVSHAHARGVIHRDLKPSNVLFTLDGTPKICDFGLAKCFESADDCTSSGQLLGTPSYMAPEQVRQTDEPVGPSADVYALGVVLYECLSGYPPFLAHSPLEVLQLVMAQDPVPLRRLQPGVPRDLETICAKCLMKEPRRRYASAGEMASDLDRFLQGRPIQARPISGLERCWRWCRAKPITAGLIGIIAIALLSVIALVTWYNRQITAAHAGVLASQATLQKVLTREVARRLDADLRELATVPATMATLLEDRTDWSSEQLETALREMLGKSHLIFGMCVAFEPRQWRPDRRDFALFVYRRAGGLKVKQLVPPSYLPLYREWEWYRAVKNAPRGRWCEPYIGEGGDKTPMVTYSSPILRRGRFVGVVTADLAITYFDSLRKEMDDLKLSPDSYWFVVSGGGRFLAHAIDDQEFPAASADLTGRHLDSSQRALAQRWVRGEEGTGQAVDFAHDRPATFIFSPVRAAGWELVLVRE